MKYKYQVASCAALMGVLAVSSPAYAGHSTVTSADGFAYVVRPGSGRLEGINKTGLADPVSSMRVLVDGTAVAGASLPRPGGEGVLVGQSTISGLTASQEMFVSSTQNLSRYLTTLSNETAGDITVDVVLQLDYTSTVTDLVESSSGDGLLDVADSSFIVDFNTGDMHVVQVYGSSGSAETVDVVSGADGSSAYSAEWSSVLVPAGETRRLMHFIVGADDLATAQSIESGVSSLLGVALKDVPSGQLNSIMNWDFTDTDGDDIPDIVETALGLDPNNPDDGALDLDGDGLTNTAEFVTHGTELNIRDTDGDGLSDGREVNKTGTSPLNADTDGDSNPDGIELARGKDPLDPSDGPIVAVTASVDTAVEHHQPQVATDKLGRRHVVWVEDTADAEIRYALIDADGQALIGTTAITSASADYQGHPSIAVDANNIAYMFWFDSNDTDDGHAFALDPANHALDGSPAVLADVKAFTDAAADADGIIDQITDMKRTSAQVDSNGYIHVAYTGDDSEIGYIIFNNTGAVIQAAFRPFDDGIDNDYATGQLRMALDKRNRAHVVWSNEDNEVQYGMVDGYTGKTLINASELNSDRAGDEQHPSVSVSSSGRVHIVWGDYDAGYLMMYGNFLPASDDQDGDAADLASIGFKPTLVELPNDEGPWYMHSNLGKNGRIITTYNTGGGNGLSPLKMAVLNSKGNVVGDVRTLFPTGEDNYTSYGNYAFVDRSGGAVAFATDEDPKNIQLFDLSKALLPRSSAAVSSSSSGGAGFGFLLILGSLFVARKRLR